ncbi:hypothetical protein ACWGN9_34700 [Streptomyces sp. NPDC055775]
MTRASRFLTDPATCFATRTPIPGAGLIARYGVAQGLRNRLHL